MPPAVGRSRISAPCGEIYGICVFFRMAGLLGQIFSWHAPYLTRPSPSAHHCRTLDPRCATANRATSRAVFVLSWDAGTYTGDVPVEVEKPGNPRPGFSCGWDAIPAKRRIYFGTWDSFSCGNGRFSSQTRGRCDFHPHFCPVKHTYRRLAARLPVTRI